MVHALLEGELRAGLNIREQAGIIDRKTPAKLVQALCLILNECQFLCLLVLIARVTTYHKAPRDLLKRLRRVILSAVGPSIAEALRGRLLFHVLGARHSRDNVADESLYLGLRMRDCVIFRIWSNQYGLVVVLDDLGIVIEE